MAGDPLEIFRDITAALTAPGGAFAIESFDDPRARQFAGTPRDLVTLIDRARTTYGHDDFLEYQDVKLTFEDALAASDRVASGLHRDYAIKPGDRVGLAMRNRVEWFIAFFAIVRLGAIATLLNSRGAAEELATTATHVGCSAVIADEERSELLRGVLDCPVIGIADMERLSGDQDALPPPALTGLDPDDAVLIIFTSGTTGRPKGATLTHRNLCAVAREMELRAEIGICNAARQFGMEVDALREVMPPPAPSLLISPLFHISGVMGVITPLIFGGKTILMRRWNAADALDIIEANAVASLSGPSLVFADMLALPNGAQRMRSLRNCSVAGQATPARLAAELREGIEAVGVASCWGQTECAGAATSGNGEIFAAFAGTVGPACELVEIRVVDGEGNDVAPGEIGELLVRGPTVMRGYWNDEAATAKALRDGWLCTGDLGWVDDKGLFYIADRAKDMVITAGENIYCAEVERVLSMLEEQWEVALFGVPDDRLGERAVAALSLRKDAARQIDADVVRNHVRAHLADYKVPAEVRFDLGPLPRNDLGKVDKAALSARYRETTRQSA